MKPNHPWGFCSTRKHLHLNLKVKKRPTHFLCFYEDRSTEEGELFYSSLEAIFIIFKAIKYGLKIQRGGRIMRISAPLNTEFCTAMHWLTLELFTPSPGAQLLKRFAAITSTGFWELAVLASQHIYLSLSVRVSLQMQSCSCGCVPQYQGVLSALQRCAAPGRVTDGPQMVADDPRHLKEWNIWGVTAAKGKKKQLPSLKLLLTALTVHQDQAVL